MKAEKEYRQKKANKEPFIRRWVFKPKALSRSTLSEHRMTISLLAMSLLAGLALNSGASNVHEIIIANEPNLMKWQLWIPTLIFLVTLVRFLLGSVIHIRTLVDDNAGPYVWLIDLSIIASELFLFNIMGNFLIPQAITMFSNLLRILLSIDVLWVIFMALGYIKSKGQGSRKSAPWQWGILNLVTVALLSFQITTTGCWSVTQDWGLLFLGILMLIMAILDVVLIDVYGLLKQ